MKKIALEIVKIVTIVKMVRPYDFKPGSLRGSSFVIIVIVVIIVMIVIIVIIVILQSECCYTPDNLVLINFRILSNYLILSDYWIYYLIIRYCLIIETPVPPENGCGFV